MEEISNSILSYREATRGLWNTYFRPLVGSSLESESLVRYEKLDELLFRSLVLAPIGKAEYDFLFRQDSHKFIHVLPMEGSNSLRLRVSDPLTSRSRSWNEAVNISGANNAELEFIELFDWNMYGWVSFPFYKVKIHRFPDRPQIENLEALVEVQTVRVHSKIEK